MSSLLQKAVDFAKHGEGISPQELERCNKYLTEVSKGPGKWPDFLDKEESESYVSESVLGKLYRGIPTDKQYESCLETEYRTSFEFKYVLNRSLQNSFLKNAA